MPSLHLKHYANMKTKRHINEVLYDACCEDKGECVGKHCKFRRDLSAYNDRFDFCDLVSGVHRNEQSFIF